jgi:hypothetical protein
MSDKEVTTGLYSTQAGPAQTVSPIPCDASMGRLPPKTLHRLEEADLTEMISHAQYFGF